MKRKTVEYGKYGYFFILPFFLVYFLFQLYPLIYTVYLSFVEYYQVKLGKFQGPNFNGIKNYILVLSDAKKGADGELVVTHWFNNKAVQSIGNTIKIWVMNFIPQMLLALLLASWFTDTVVKLKGQGAFKIMMFMPNIITASSIAVLFYSLFSANGPIAQMIGDRHIMESPGKTVGLIAFMQFWMWYGNTMIVLIAGIPFALRSSHGGWCKWKTAVLLHHTSIAEADYSVQFGYIMYRWFADVRYSVTVQCRCILQRYAKLRI